MCLCLVALGACVTTTSRSAAPFVPLASDETVLFGASLSTGVPIGVAYDDGDVGVSAWARARLAPPVELTLHARSNLLRPTSRRRWTTAAGMAGAFLLDAGPLRIGTEASVEAETWRHPSDVAVPLLNLQGGVPMLLQLGEGFGLFGRATCGVGALGGQSNVVAPVYHFSAGARARVLDDVVVLLDAGLQQDTTSIAYLAVSTAWRF